MAAITFDHVKKVYPDGFVAIPDLNLEIADGEFVVFVGPSGCGKSTALRMVAGLESISGGQLRIGERAVNDVPPQDRDIAMVFQDYALYPHMTVGENMGFALRMMKLPKDEINQRVQKAADRLSLTALLDKKPKNLSGGQRQRVAMGRAIVREPAAFLMDEPLSNLDAKLRVQMRAEISSLQSQLGITTIYVTHDQVEAMTMGDRVAVMRAGVLQQCASPKELYRKPANVFVAGFMGSPKMNLFKSTLRRHNGELQVSFGPAWLPLSQAAIESHPRIVERPDGPIILGVRPEGISVSNADNPGSVEVLARVVEDLGNEMLVYFEAPVERASDGDQRDQAAEEAATDDIVANDGNSVFIARLTPAIDLSENDKVRFAVDPGQLYFFDADGEALR